MVAKLIVTGETREQAIERMLSALERFHVKGIRTTIPFCKAVLHNETYRNGDFDTSFIESRLSFRFGGSLTRSCWVLCLRYIHILTRIHRRSVPTPVLILGCLINELEIYNDRIWITRK